MKRLLVVLCLFLAGVLVMGQSNKVQSAINYLKPAYNELDKAKVAIDLATIHPKTQGKAKTWYYRGECYYKLFLSNDKAFKDLHADPLNEAYHAFVKAKELDERKTYPEIDYKLIMIGTAFFNKGSMEYDEKAFKKSLQSFETAIDIGRLPYINQVDTPAFFNAAIAADLAGLYDVALRYYDKSIEYKYMGSEVYHYAATVKLNTGDTLAAIKYYEDGIEAYPEDNAYLYIQLINHYLGNKELEKAAKYIGPALEKDSLNASLWSVYAQANEGKNEAEVIAGYSRAIELDSTLFDPYYSLGIMYFNHGVDANKEAMSIPLNEQEAYDAVLKKRDDYFNQALPYFEKANEIDQTNGELLTALKEIYYRFNMKEKLEVITKLIEDRK
ncbi:MAG: hypothetical protein HN352_12155 [Bacteroidetes bacterium]|jgi:tetratricopeptide (TPR) repeat protein|nr:hypothetical protein [Bacteroidota bacterium]MBT3749444.1 hypothetical protein [Bacteroidota bacterium]MBT4401959.1 hypothetical protein [Bacteroidota bacterium]MBT4410427.1 hypothetical protein [Bacteroidota bacterium]MBT5425891.1 hypothetical protein [Bacteroidota bacterium]